MTTNKKITLVIVILAVVIIAFGIVKGKKQYQEYNYTVDTEQSATVNTDGEKEKLAEGERCIITIQGGNYDVTEFKSQHTGGDIFKCGEDMTKSFAGKHKGYLPMIEKFKVD